MLMLNRSFRPIQADLNQLFNQFADASCCAPTGARAGTALPINVWEEEHCFRIEAELPGYAMNNIEVTVLGDEVTIKAERTMAERDGATYLRRERRGGSLLRTLTLPSEIDAAKVEASLRDGVLLVSLPKSEKAMPRKIQVKVAGA